MRAYRDEVATDDDPDVRLALGICLLKLGLFDLATEHITAAIADDVDNAEAFLYAAIAALGGKRPFQVPIANVKRALEYLDAARMLEDRGIFDYLSGLIRQDFFERKYLRISPTSAEEMSAARLHNVTQADIQFVHNLARIPT